MTETATLPAVTHATFSVERVYPQGPAKVFFAHADQATTRRWRVEGEGFHVSEHTMDFRVGGDELARFRFGDGPDMTCETQYHAIWPDRRMVFSYRMTIGGEPLSASLVTIELAPVGGGTRLTYTEQGTYFGDPDGPGSVSGREEGTRQLLESLAAELAR